MQAAIRFRMAAAGGSRRSLGAMGAAVGLGWDEMRDLLAVVETGSLSAAARALGVSQSTVSRRIATIEARGLVLFEPGPGVALTPLGRELVTVAGEMRAAFSRAEAVLGMLSPTVQVAACEVTSRVFLADLMPEWSQEGRGTVEPSVHDDLFALRPGSYDLMVTPLEAPPLSPAIRLGSLDWALHAVPAYLERHPHAAPFAGLAGHRVIGASGSLARFACFEWLAELGGDVALRASSPMAQLEACARGQGIALLPCQLAASDPRLVRLDAPEPAPSQVWMVALPDRASLPHVAVFLRRARRWSRRAATAG